MGDDEIIPLLRRLPRPTFFTGDLGFYRHGLCHSRYCIVCMDITKDEVATFARRLLRHPAFNTWSERSGTVIRLHHVGLRAWHLGSERETVLTWE
jgi:hypothetical protein